MTAMTDSVVEHRQEASNHSKMCDKVSWAVQGNERKWFTVSKEENGT